MFEVPPKIELMLASFFVTLSIYTLNKVTDKEEDKINAPERSKIANSPLTLPVAIIAYIAALIMGGIDKIIFVIILMIPLLSGIFYSIKIASVRLKDIFLMKNMIIAFSCTSVAVAPFFYSNDINALILVAYFFFIKIFINTIIFDLRDVEGDRKANVRTVPVVIGVKKTEKILLLLNSTLLIWVVMIMNVEKISSMLPVFLISIVYGYFYIIQFSRRKIYNRLIYDLTTDGEWNYLFLLTIVFQNVRL
ncbi:MAG: UbiA family prenyltransferase [Thermoplasmata archaeon]|nr:UbiA family prenyltransferase [Thermoplasmata archaeon]